MAADKSKKPSDNTSSEEGKSENSVSDFLQGPRRRRKAFVMMCMRENFDADLHLSIVNFIQTNFSQYAVTTPKTIAEMQRQMSRNIALLIVDDQFAELDQVLEQVDALKQKSKHGPVPTLFFSRNSDDLIKAYHEKLLHYHEIDEMVPYDRLSAVQVLARVRVGLEQSNRRKSRRYKVNVPLTFFHLQGNRQISGHLMDLSVHGAKLVADEDGFVFRAGDQLKLNLPISEFILPVEGDFLKLSAKVRRVFISGNAAGISFEHMSDNQFLNLTKYLTSLVNHQILRNQRLATQQKLGGRR